MPPPLPPLAANEPAVARSSPDISTTNTTIILLRLITGTPLIRALAHMSKCAVSIGSGFVSYQYSAIFTLSCDHFALHQSFLSRYIVGFSGCIINADLFDLIRSQTIRGDTELDLEATGEIRM